LYVQEVQKTLLQLLAENQSLPMKSGSMVFSSASEVNIYAQRKMDVRSRVLPVDDTNTSIGFDNRLFLKIYRHVDRTINPDVEITMFLTRQVQFPQVPSLLGTIEWKVKKDTMVLGMLQEQVGYHGNGRTYMLERLNNYLDRIQARTVYPVMEKIGTLAKPVMFEVLPEDLQEFIGGTVAEGATLIGKRTGEMHLALASQPAIKDFAAEPFSLHYQRSLFSGMQTLVRSAFSAGKEQLSRLPEEIREEVISLLKRKEEVLKKLKRIYTAKIDVVKIRIHGNYDLKQVLFTGKDVAILDFHGDPTRSYSDRRLKRSPLRDVAGMIRSIHYVAYEGLQHNAKTAPEELTTLEPFADYWIHYVTSFFVRSWMDTVAGSSFIPPNETDLRILLESYLLEKAIYSFQFELHKRPEWLAVPVNIIRSIIDQERT
jgi:maltose alpha-D-glucosyltransferase/alpha-amylase